MKKIININLSGRVIPIEDSAYEKLQAYIESLRRYFAHEEGRDEIINDIESRIAELLFEKVRKGAAAITDEDVNSIIASMGRPEDFDEPAAETEPSSQQSKQEYAYSEKKKRGRLYRDTSDKFIGGVCSGIAAYLNVDPAIIRILFAIITFGGFGLGFFAYILLWMVLPPKDLEGYRGKRLFRNPDDRILGGVAGGLAAYFGKSSKTIRLIFAAPLILSILIGFLDDATWHNGFDLFPNLVFGSLTSTFLLAYIILWMVLPEASSTYEKMEMRGEKVDVNTIRQNVKEGVDSMKDKVKNWSEEVKDSAQNLGNKAREFTNTRGKAFAKEVSEVTSSSGRGLGHAIGVLFKVFFLFIAGSIAFGLFVAVIALIFGGVAWWPVNNFLWTSKWQQIYAWGTFIFFILVPLIGFITWVIRRILRTRSRHNYLGWTFGFLWTIGWIAAILLTISIAKDFRAYDYTASDVTVQQPANGKMILAVSQPELDYTGSFEWMDDDGDAGWDLNADTLKLSIVRFDIQASKDSLYYVTIKRYSYGRTDDEAKTRANKIQYMVTSRDSVLDLANGYAIDKDSKFRGQQVEVEVLVPIGKKIRFDQSVNDKLNPAKIRVRRSVRNNRGLDIDIEHEYWRRFQPNIDYVMGIDGRLKDPGGNTVSENDYRYRPVQDTITSVEEQRRKVKEEQDRLKQMEESENKKQPAPSSKNESMDEKDESVTEATNPLATMLSWL